MNGQKLAILMCTYQGEKYLPQQLASFRKQTFKNWELWVSDDGSNDATVSLLESFKRDHHSVLKLIKGPQEGFVRNFLSLLCTPAIEADFYALSDQDDVWHSDKLERAVSWLNTQPENTPSLYCSRMNLVDESGRSIGRSSLHRKKPAFPNALVQNICSGNTIVMNKAARTLLREAGPHIDVVHHDRWIYLLISGAGGTIYYDPEPTIDYCQHANNNIGSGSDWLARIKQLYKLTTGVFRDRSEQHVVELSQLQHMLTGANREILGHFCKLRSDSIAERIKSLRKARIYRQSSIETLGLFVAVLMKCI